MYTEFQVNNLYSNWDIHVQKIKVDKMVLNSYFQRNNANHILKYNGRVEKIIIFHLI